MVRCGWMGYLRLCRWKVWRLVVSQEFLGVEPFRPAAGYRDVDTEMERHVYSVGSGVACSALRWVYFCTVPGRRSILSSADVVIRSTGTSTCLKMLNTALAREPARVGYIRKNWRALAQRVASISPMYEPGKVKRWFASSLFLTRAEGVRGRPLLSVVPKTQNH